MICPLPSSAAMRGGWRREEGRSAPRRRPAVTRAVVVDLLCNTPYYCGPLVGALRAEGVEAELASPAFYLEPDFLADLPGRPVDH